MPGERETPAMVAAEALAERLGAAGRAWRDAVPADCRITSDGDPVLTECVTSADGEQVVHRYNADGEHWWSVVGWSDASRRWLYRPRPMTEAEHFANLHTDDDGTL